MRVGILGTLENPYIADLQRAAREHYPDIETRILRYGDLQAGLGIPTACSSAGWIGMPSKAVNDFYRPRSLQSAVTMTECPSDLVGLDAASAASRMMELDVDAPRMDIEALIIRSMPIGTLEQVIFRMDCLQAWHARGLPMINPPRCLEIAIDKWLCLHRLSQAGIDVPATVCCQTRSAAMQALEVLGGDVLVKPLFGGEGRGILRVDNKDMAWRMFGTLQQLGQVLYLQQFVDHFGYDIRVLFIGDRQYAIRRVAPDGGWRTNISQGSRAEAYHLSSREAQLAGLAKAEVGGSLLGVDLLPARDGRMLVLEVNAVPGWRGLSAALGVDVARQIFSWLIEES